MGILESICYCFDAPSRLFVMNHAIATAQYAADRAKTNAPHAFRKMRNRAVCSNAAIMPVRAIIDVVYQRDEMDLKGCRQKGAWFSSIINLVWSFVRNGLDRRVIGQVAQNLSCGFNRARRLRLFTHARETVSVISVLRKPTINPLSMMIDDQPAALISEEIQ